MNLHNPFIIIDGSSFLYRAYYSPPHLTNSSGQATGAIFGVINMLNSLKKQYNPQHMVVAFDVKEKSFRSELSSEYKANREAMPADLIEQVEPLHAVIAALGIVIITKKGYEADDIIGTLVKKTNAQNKKQQILICSSDKDLAQLVNENTFLLNTSNNICLDPQGVADKFGVPPDKIIDYLAIVGDKSDNVTGLAGVGEKTATALINQVGGIDAIYENLDSLATLSVRGAKTLATKITENKDTLELARKLVTIDCDVDIAESMADLSLQPVNNKELIDLYTKLEFKKLLKEQLAAAQDDASVNNEHEKYLADTNYQCVVKKEELTALVAKLAQAEQIAVDTETSSLDYMSADLVGISIAVTPQEAYYIPLQHTDNTITQLETELVIRELQPVFADTDKSIIGQNIKYDLNILQNHGLHIKAKLFDTMIASYVLNPTAVRHNLTDLAWKYLNVTMQDFTDVAGKGAKQVSFNEVELKAAVNYACMDADITLQLHHVLHKKLAEFPSLMRVYTDIDLPFVPVLAAMEREGVNIDVQMLAQQSQDVAARIKDLEQQAFELAGEEFNLGSTKQLQYIFYEKFSYPIYQKTPKGAPSTSESVLVDLALEYPLASVILEYRGLSKLLNTYIDKLPSMINPKTNKIHTNYHQAVTSTGRLSSTNPNLQNIPIKNEEGKKIRSAFVPSTADAVILSADYSQIELRVMAHMAQDANLLTAFRSQTDVHTLTATEIFDISADEVGDEHRRTAKAVNFGLIYGMSEFGLSKQLGISRFDAKRYITNYFKKYPDVEVFLTTVRNKTKELGFAETLCGRRLYLPDINAKNKLKQAAATRAAINAYIQGSAADLIKIAMLNIHDWLLDNLHLNIKMLMQVHDELVFEVPKANIEVAQIEIKRMMESAMQLDVSLDVNINIDVSW